MKGCSPKLAFKAFKIRLTSYFDEPDTAAKIWQDEQDGRCNPAWHLPAGLKGVATINVKDGYPK